MEHARETRRALLHPGAVERVRDDLELEIEGRAQHADLDVKPASGAAALEQPRQHAEREKRRAVLVDDGGADRGRRLAGSARDRLGARGRLAEEAPALPLAVVVR